MLKGAINLITAIFMAGSPAAGTAPADITDTDITQQAIVEEVETSENKSEEKISSIPENTITNPQVNSSENVKRPKKMGGYAKSPSADLEGSEITIDNSVKEDVEASENREEQPTVKETDLIEEPLKKVSDVTESQVPKILTETESSEVIPLDTDTIPTEIEVIPAEPVIAPENTEPVPAVPEIVPENTEPEPEGIPETVPEQREQPAETPQEVIPQVQDNNYDWDIASYTTHYSTNKGNYNRNFNMQLASDAINGTILQPGESFTYNGTILGKRDRNNDYKSAGILIAGKPATGIGGGICQISSTLYEAALYSGMTITERHNHSAMVGYMPAGRDATVSWGGPDLCFRNDLSVPVKIESVMGDGTIKIRFLSMDDPQIGNIEVNVARKNGGYVLTRYRDGVADYSASSWY